MRPDLQLMPYQVRAVKLLAAKTRGMLAYDMGTGKTPIAIKACDAVGAKRILVICPPIATGVWLSHFCDWSSTRHDIKVMNANHVAHPYPFCRGDGVKIVAYSYMGREMNEHMVKATWSTDPWDVVIIDEGHYLKNSESRRTRAVYGPKLDLQKSPCLDAKHIWCLTGTPLLNHPAEFWTHLNALVPETLKVGKSIMSEEHFLARFCVSSATKFGMHVVGARKTHELAERVKPFMDRKRMKEVRPDMPSLRIVDYTLPEDTPISDELRAELDRFTQETGDVALSDDELLATVQSGNVSFSSARRLIGKAKVNGIADLVENDLEGTDEKLIVFTHHRDVIDALARRLDKWRPLVIHGGTPHGARHRLINAFQTDDKCRLIILAIEAAGEVITLTASHNVIIGEPSPVPARNMQAIARARRIGQLFPVLARFVLLPGTIDARLMQIAARKTREIAEIVDPETTPPKPQPQPQPFPEERI